MRKKENVCVVAFQTATDAMAVEEQCRREGMPGRIIPLHTEISAGCGLSFMVPALYKEELLLFLETRKLKYRSITDLFL